MECRCCQSLCVKKGCQNRRQKYYCKNCRLYQQKTYTYKRCTKDDESMIIRLNNEGMGISSIARITGISKAHVVKKISQLASKIKRPEFLERQQEYEVDEMHTYIRKKSSSCYITYTINKNTRQVIDFVVGQRTKENISRIIGTLDLLYPKAIFTDKLNIYPTVIPRGIHVASSYKTNRIERFNLTLRTHLRRLSRKTICFSKSRNMIENCLLIYLWGHKTVPSK